MIGAMSSTKLAKAARQSAEWDRTNVALKPCSKEEEYMKAVLLDTIDQKTSKQLVGYFKQTVRSHSADAWKVNQTNTKRTAFMASVEGARAGATEVPTAGLGTCQEPLERVATSTLFSENMRGDHRTCKDIWITEEHVYHHVPHSGQNRSERRLKKCEESEELECL